MAISPLLYELDLEGFAGAPFVEAAVTAVGERIRDACRWHVSPVVTETLTVDSRGGIALFLPTLKLTAVSAVRDVTDPDAPVAITGYRWSTGGVLTRTGGMRWPYGSRTVEVDITHGYPTCPAALVEWAAELLRASGRGGEVRSQTTGPFGVSFGAGGLSTPPVPAEQYVILPC